MPRKPAKITLLAAAVLASGCVSERTIPTRAHPQGETIKCVGLDGKRKQPGIDYDVSARNVFWGIIGLEVLAPPIIVAVRETFCPVSDTSKVTP